MRYLTFTLLLAALTSSVFASQNKEQVVLRIQAQSGNIDEATLYFDQGITPAYVYQEDAQKVFSGVSGVPVLYSLTSDLVDCSINGYGPVSTAQEIALGYDVDADDVYDISAVQLDNVDPTSIVRLEDRTLGVFTDLRQNKYSAQLGANDPATGRFFLHISSPVKVTATAAGCSNDNGVINVNQDNTFTWTTCKLFDSFNNELGSYNDVTGQFNFNNLAEGDYTIEFNYNNYSASKSFHVAGHYLVAEISTSTQQAEVGQAIDFSAITTHASTYRWDFGDGTIITGVANPTINYFAAGNYTVTLTCTNDYGCSDNAEINIVVTSATISGIAEQKKNELSVFTSGKKVTVNLNDEIDNAHVAVYNLIGQPVYASALTTSTEVASLDEVPNGYYLVSVKNGGATTTRRVFLSK